MVDAVVNQHIQYHLDCLTDKKVFIVTLPDIVPDYSYFVMNRNVNVDPTYLLNCPDEYDCILIDYATNYLRAGIEQTIYDQLAQHILPKPWFIITSDFKYYYEAHEKIIYYPIYLIDGLDKGGNTPIDIKRPRGHLTCFLTYHYHWHRLLILNGLHQQIGFDSCLLNLYEINSMTASQRQSLDHSRRYLLPAERELTDEIFKLAPITSDPVDKQTEIVNLENRAFFDSYINVFSESDYPAAFVTEKVLNLFYLVSSLQSLVVRQDTNILKI